MVTMKLVALLLTACVAATATTKARYDKYKAVKINIATKEQFSAVQDLESLGYILLGPLRNIGKESNIVVPPHKLAEFEEIVEKFKLNTTIVTENLQAEIDKEAEGGKGSTYVWSEYHTLEETYQWLQAMVSNHPKILSTISVGQSFQGRPIHGVKLSHKPGNRAVFIEANMHAAEWISSRGTRAPS